MEVLVSKENIHKLIPHREPVILVDQLVSYTEKKAISTLFISSQNIFTNKEGQLIESGLIENIAQTVALHQGYEYYIKEIPAPIGYIGSIRKLNIAKLPQNNHTIETHINVLDKIMGMTIVEGKVIYQGEVIAWGEMRLVNPE